MKIHVCDGCGADLDGSHMLIHESLRVKGVEEVCPDCYSELVEAVVAADRVHEALRLANVRVAIANLVAGQA